MDERRDLVDREELRRRLETERDGCITAPYIKASIAIGVLDAMPAADCPRGWTRDEVLTELDADPDAVCEVQDPFSAKWVPWAHTWVGQWLDPDVPRTNVRVVRVAPEPEWVPLTQLVGRTIHGCHKPTFGYSGNDVDAYWWAFGDLKQPFPEGTLNLETGQVAVRPKAAT